MCSPRYFILDGLKYSIIFVNTSTNNGMRVSLDRLAMDTSKIRKGFHIEKYLRIFAYWVHLPRIEQDRWLTSPTCVRCMNEVSISIKKNMSDMSCWIVLEGMQLRYIANGHLCQSCATGSFTTLEIPIVTTQRDLSIHNVVHREVCSPMDGNCSCGVKYFVMFMDIQQSWAINERELVLMGCTT